MPRFFELTGLIHETDEQHGALVVYGEPRTLHAVVKAHLFKDDPYDRIGKANFSTFREYTVDGRPIVAALFPYLPAIANYTVLAPEVYDIVKTVTVYPGLITELNLESVSSEHSSTPTPQHSSQDIEGRW